MVVCCVVQRHSSAEAVYVMHAEHDDCYVYDDDHGWCVHDDDDHGNCCGDLGIPDLQQHPQHPVVLLALLPCTWQTVCLCVHVYIHVYTHANTCCTYTHTCTHIHTTQHTQPLQPPPPHTHLTQNHTIQRHRPQTPHNPRGLLHHCCPILSSDEYARPICYIGTHCTEKHGQCKTFH